MRRLLLLLPLLCWPAVGSAQTSTVVDANLPVPPWAQAAIDSFDKPLHPVIGGVVSGGGLGVGIGYDSPETERVYRNAEAMVTLRRYWSLEGEIGRRSLNKRGQIGAFAASRHMGRIDYFGIGPDSTFDNRSAFRLRETTFGTRGWYRPLPAVRLGGSTAVYRPQLGPGSNPTVPSIEERFSESSVPGFSATPTFGRYRGFAELTYPVVQDPDSPDKPEVYTATYQLAVESVRDHSSGRHDFHRWEGEVQQRFPGFRPGQRLTLHGFIASTNQGADIPFYLLYTLGGSGGLKAFRPDLLGGDGTRATLRGFRNFRFRDRDVVLMQAEYRVPLHQKVHATVFLDAGQVAPRTAVLFNDLRTSTGFSLSYVHKGRSLGRLDVGFGGGEGVHLFWSFGAFQN